MLPRLWSGMSRNRPVPPFPIMKSDEMDGLSRRSLFKFYWWAEQKVVPGLRSSQYTYYETLRRVLNGRRDWLELGCGHQVFADWMTSEQDDVVATRRVIGIDLDWDGLRKHPAITRKVFGDLRRLPIQSESMDVVTANMVVEHLDDPTTVLKEAYRVLRPGGVFVFHTPSYFHWVTRVSANAPERLKKFAISMLDGRSAADVFPTYHRLNTAEAIQRHADAAALTVSDIQYCSGSATLPMLGPLVLLELLYIRLIQRKSFEPLRSNLVVILTKPGAATLQ
jgi:ubiquinone/menaquinone biosynthesis C-methylase UbiE